MKKLIYALDDEADILALIEASLQDQNLQVQTFTNCSDFEDAVIQQLPDLVILDLMLPGKDGFEICKDLKKAYSKIPVLMLTARGDITDKVLGLELGADDYLTKPFHPKELLARVRAALRRSSFEAELIEREVDKVERRVGSSLVIKFDTHQVLEFGKEISLTFAEFSILDLLSEKPNIVFSREKILDFVWGQDKIVTDRSVDVHVTKLRNKLKSVKISSVRSVGYKLEIL